MKTIEEIIDILKGKKGTKISIFCGAGISIISGLPGVSMFLEYTLNRLGIERTEINALRSIDGKWLMPFESFMDAFIEHDKNTKLFDIYLLGKPNHNHFLIKRLANHACLDEVYTTNFDLLIERMFEADPKLGFKVILENDTLNNIHSDKLFPIIKLHGTADRVDTIKSTIFSITSGVGFENRKKLVQRAFNSTSDVLWFWGYSCSDVFDISPTIELMQPSNKTIILLKHDSNIKEIDRAIIVPIDKAGVDHPLRKFDGYMIQVDSDSLVESVLGIEYRNDEETIDPSEWKRVVEEWIFSFKYVHVKSSILCHLFYKVAQYELALKYNDIAIRLNGGKDKRDEGAALSNRGMILFNTGRSSEAINMFLVAMEKFNESGSEIGVATSYNNIGYVFGQMGNVEDGIKHIQAGLDYIEGKTFEEAQKCRGYLLRSKGELKQIKGELVAAEDNFNVALEIFKNGYKAEESEVLMRKGMLCRMTGMDVESNKLLNEALTLATKVGNYEVIQKCAHLLAGLSEYNVGNEVK